jgi:hypothetical protein
MKRAEAAKADHFARRMLPGEHSADNTVGYVLLILAHHGEAPGDAYTEYRKRRMAILENPTLKRAIGIGVDASSKVTGREGGSEDFYALEVPAWTPELEKRANDLKEEFGLLKPENVTHAARSADEFPRAADDESRSKPETETQRATRGTGLGGTKAKRAGVTIKPDPTWPNMWRVHLPTGQVTDMTNLTRAKDAARSFSRSGS